VTCLLCEQVDSGARERREWAGRRSGLPRDESARLLARRVIPQDFQAEILHRARAIGAIREDVAQVRHAGNYKEGLNGNRRKDE
jgi:hypothetical protein